MKNKMIYGKPQDNFIWKIEPTYSPLEKLHLKLAKWHLRKFFKIDKEALDKLYQKEYNSLINEMLRNYTPYNNTVMNITAEQLIDKINEINEVYAVSVDDIKKGLENTANVLKRYPLWNTESMCNAVVELKGDSNESAD